MGFEPNLNGSNEGEPQSFATLIKHAKSNSLKVKKARLRGEAQPSQQKGDSPDERIHQWGTGWKGFAADRPSLPEIPRAHPFMVHGLKRGLEYA
jgi:hypothetical protein